MDRYSARMNLHGSTKRERELNRLKSDIVRKAPSSLSYKDVKLNGEPTQLMINTSTKPYYKETYSHSKCINNSDRQYNHGVLETILLTNVHWYIS